MINKSFFKRRTLARSIAALFVGGATLAAGITSTAQAQTQNYFTGVGGSSLAGSFWSTAPAGPYTSALDVTGGAIINFGNLNTTVAGASVTVAGINATANTTISTIGGTISNNSNVVIPINVANGVTLDFNTQSFTSSTTAGYTFNGNSSGVLALAGGTYGATAVGGAFTLNSGTVILRGINALGNGVLNINGGTIAANANRAVVGITQINVGNNFTIGGTTGLATTASTISFTAPVALGAATRTITVGGSATYTFSGIVSGDPGTGLNVISTSPAAATGVLVLSGANTYTGPTTVTNSILRLGNATALSGGYAATGGTSALTINNSVVELGAADFLRDLGTGVDQVQLTGSTLGFGAVTAARTVNFNNDGHTIQWGSASFSPTTFVLNAATSNNKITFANAIDLNGATRTVAVNANTAEISNVISTTSGTAGLTKIGSGTLILGGANTYNGTTTITNGTLQIGNGVSGSLAASSSPIVFNGATGGLNIRALDGGSSLTLSDVTFASTAGDATLQSTYGTSGNADLTFSALAARAAGTTRNYVVSGGTNGTTNKIVITGATANSFIDQGTFFGGSDFVWNDAAGYVRAINYSGDAGAATSAATTSLTGTAHQQITGAISAQASATFTTLKISGASNFAMDVGQTVTVNGILKTGNNGATISGGLGIQPDLNSELVIRTNQGGDTLTMSTPILANGTNSVTKSGPGTLTITATTSGTYTGGTIINAGTINIQGALASGSDNPLGTGPITINSGTLQLSRNVMNNDFTVANGTITSGNSFGSTVNSNIVVNGVLTTMLNNGQGNIAYNGNISGPGSILHLGTRQDANTILAGTNTYTGTTTISGVLRIAKQVSLYNNNTANWTADKIIVGGGGIAIFNVGGTGEFTASDITMLSGLGTASGGFTNGSALGLSTASGNFSYSGVIANTNGGANEIGLYKFGANTLTLTGNNTYTGVTNLTAGTLSVSSVNNLGNANALVFNGGTLQVTGTTMTNLGSHVPTFTATRAVGLDIAAAANIFTISQILNQTTGTLTKTGAGTLALTNSNTYTGITSVNAGVLLLNDANALPGGIGATGGTSALTFNGGVIGLGVGDFTRSLAASGTVTAATFSGNGGWAAYNANRVVNLGGALAPITWGTSGTGLNSRTLILGALTATHSVDFQNPLDLGTATRTVQTDDGAASVDGVLSGVLSGGVNGALTKTGAGTLVLSGANTYTGKTTVSAGTLKAGVATISNTSGAFGINSAVVMGNVAGATLDITGFNTEIGSLSGGGTTGGNVTLGAATLTMGGDNTSPLAYAGAISGNGSIIKIGTGTQILTGTNSYLGGTTISAGTLQVGTGGTVGTGSVTNDATFDVARAALVTAAITGTGNTTVNTTGASLTANSIRQAGLTIGAGNTVTVATNGGNSGTSVVTNLSIDATGKLDLANNDLIVDNGNLATLTAKLATGLDINGTYGNGPGITSSAFASNPNFNTVLGIAANVELGYTSFSGQTVDANDILIKYTYYGDADLSGSVDTSTDFDLYITGLTSGGSLGGWLFGDFDYSGTVDSSTDFDLYITGLTTQGGPLLTAGGGGNLVQAVPEPSTFVLAGVGLLGCAGLRLRRRRLARCD